MSRRLAPTLLTVLALIWQGLAAAAMVPAWVEAAPSARLAAGSAPMSEHCRQRMAAAAKAQAAAPVTTPAKPRFVLADCCAGGTGHGPCALACGLVALPAATTVPDFTTPVPPSAPAPSARLAEALPPHPFRPPISATV